MNRPPVRKTLTKWLVAFGVALQLAGPAHAAIARQLDWDVLTWTAGSLTATYTVGGGDVTLTVGGETSSLTALSGTPTPHINNQVNAGLSPAQDSLHFRVDHPAGATDEITITVDFTHTGGVQDVSFTTFDVDAGNPWIDEVQATATDGSSTFNPSSIVGASCVGQLDASTVEGTCNVNNNSGDGNTTFTFNQIGITQVTIVYRNTVALSNPGVQRVTLHDIDFSETGVDLSLTKTVNDSSPNVGSNVAFTVTVANDAGADNATGVEVTDLLPAGYTYVSDDGAGAYDSGTGLWDVGSLSAGSSLILNITALVNAAGNYTNEAEVTAADQADVDDIFGDGSGEDYDTALTTPISLPITKRAFQLDGTPIVDGSTFPAKTSFRFLLYINNQGAAVSDVSLQDVLDPLFSYAAGSIVFDNATPSCVLRACSAAEEDAIFAGVDTGAPGTDSVDGDVTSFAGVTLDVGNQVMANGQLDIAGTSVWAVLFTVRMQ